MKPVARGPTSFHEMPQIYVLTQNDYLVGASDERILINTLIDGS